jgi:dethiobiotin synthetase/adenosylmethionine--8-amino-7-oxononanoate aminotransferase
MSDSDPLFQRTLVKVVRQNPHLFSGTKRCSDSPTDDNTWTGLPVIFDEVFTGLYRLGRFSSASFLGVDADISVHAKLLTGGLVPLSVTLASESIFQAFESDDKSDALLHGHSYTAHAVGCQVALQSIREMQKMDERGDWEWARSAHAESETEMTSQEVSHKSKALVWSAWSPEFVLWIGGLPATLVGGVWALGTVLAIRMASTDGTEGYKGGAAITLHTALLESQPCAGSGSGSELQWNVHTRVLGNTLYVMAGQKTSQGSIERLETRLREALLKVQG